MTRLPNPYAAPLATLAMALVMPLILNVTPMSADPLPTLVTAKATAGVSSGQLA